MHTDREAILVRSNIQLQVQVHLSALYRTCPGGTYLEVGEKSPMVLEKNDKSFPSPKNAPTSSLTYSQMENWYYKSAINLLQRQFVAPK